MKPGIVSVVAIAAILPLLGSGDEKPATRFHLYYGNSPEELARLTARFAPGAIVVVDTRVLKRTVLKTLQTDAARSGTRVLGYLSIGEVHRDEIEALKRHLGGEASAALETITIDHNETFDSRRVDVSAKPLRSWLHGKANRILDLGIDGLFLDTVDTVDRYITHRAWDLERRKHSIDAMISLIRSFKETHPEAYILQNGGLNLIGETVFVGNAEGVLLPALHLARSHPSNPDGLLRENAFAGSDAWSMGRLAELLRIRKAGHTDVFALGYRKSLGEDPGPFFAKCRKHRFIGAWAESSEVLHEAATISAPDP